jgi:hypothetical protein
MMILRRAAAPALFAFAFLLPPAAPPAGAVAAARPRLLAAQDAKGPALSEAIQRIKDEGLNRSQVMQTLSYLSDVIGPRLTGSPNLRRANEWTRDQLASWGLQSAHLEAWGPFGRGWSLQRFSAQVVEPQDIPLIAFPKAWSPGLDGTLTAEVVYLEAKDEADLQKYRGQLKGKIALISPLVDVKAHFDPQGTRRTDADLQRLADAKPLAPGARRGEPGGGPGRGRFGTPEQRAQLALANRKLQLCQEEGAALVIEASRRGDGGTLFVQSATIPGAGGGPGGGAPGAGGPRVSPWDQNAPKLMPQIVLASEHYNRILRILQAGQRVKLAVDLAVRFHDDDPMAYNTIAEIPGSDLKEQLVMLGGHMDSWHSGTGATDNGAGVAVAMEAVRILEALKLAPRRTVRIGLWSGEEQGLRGSRAYVTQHFGHMENAGGPGMPGMLVKGPEYDRLSAYFNLDNGTGKIRGVYMQGNETVGPIFRDWLEPFKEMGATTLTISNTGGTDHLSFDGIGLPGFQFIQDEIEYESRTHHSNQDVFDRIQADDLKQASVIMAAFVYQTAMRDDPLPRKPLPMPAQ